MTVYKIRVREDYDEFEKISLKLELLALIVSLSKPLLSNPMLCVHVTPATKIYRLKAA
jgi:hypothetical protein